MDLGLWNGSVIPLWQNLVKDDRHGLLEALGNFAASLVKLVKEFNGDSKPLLGLGLSHELANDLKTLENDALTSPSHVRKERMFNRIVLRAIGWEMGNTDFNPDLVDQSLQVLLKDVMARVVAAAPITENEKGGGIGIVELSMLPPPVADAVTSKLTGIRSGADVDKAMVAL